MATPLAGLQATQPLHLSEPAYITPESTSVLWLAEERQKCPPPDLRGRNTRVGFQTPSIVTPRPLPGSPQWSGPKTPEMPHSLCLIEA